MEQIAMLEAKNHLSEIAKRVKLTGRPVTLVERGEPVADLVPHPTDTKRRSMAEIGAELIEIQRGMPKIAAAEIRGAVEEGRH